MEGRSTNWGTFLEVPCMRILVSRDLYWVPPPSGNCHLGFSGLMGPFWGAYDFLGIYSPSFGNTYTRFREDLLQG